MAGTVPGSRERTRLNGKEAVVVDTAAAAVVAGRWLEMDAGEAGRREQELADGALVYVRADDGRAVLVDSRMRVLVASPAVPVERLIADFTAGWRTDWVAPAHA
jgi:hypothetical protein